MSWELLLLAFLVGAALTAVLLVYVVKAYQEPPPECSCGHVFEDYKVENIRRDNPIKLEVRLVTGGTFYLYGKAKTTCSREECDVTDEKWQRIKQWKSPHNVPTVLRPDR